MKQIILAIVVLLASFTLKAQKTTSIDSVSSYLGKEVRVCADYYGMKETDKVTLINIGAAFPKSPLTIVIYAKDKEHFKDLLSTFQTDRTTLCVSGIVSEFKGKMQIAVENVEQVQTSYRRR
jgi:DNA/RNA endonuclease YhcR with UshA esterase domain